MSFCRAFTAFQLPMIGKNSTRNFCGINNIAQTALVEFLPIMGSRKAVDARNDRCGDFHVYWWAEGPCSTLQDING